MAAGGSAEERARELRDEARRLEREAAQWERGAEGERRVAAVLDRLPADFVVFHDLQLPGSKANVDHLVIGVGGIWAIDAKFYSNKITRGTGAGAATLWTGRTRLYDTLRTTACEATKVGELIGVTVWPMMCVIAPSIPEPAFDFDGVRICEPASLEAQLFGSVAGPIDVVGATNAVQRVFGAEPDPRRPRPPHSVGAEVATAPKDGRRRSRGWASAEPATIRVGKPGVDWAKVFSFPLIRLAAVVAVFAVFIAVLPTAVDWASGRASDVIVDSDQRVTPTSVAQPPTSATMADGRSTVPSTTPTAPASFAPPPPVRYVTTCPSPGAGWVVNWVWPGSLPDGAAGYRVRTQRDGGPILVYPGIGVWDDPAEPPVAIRIGSTDLMVFTDVVGPDGNAAATTQQPFAAPTGTC